MGRAGWYSEHPPTCSCVECTEKRLSRPGKITLRQLMNRFVDMFRRKR